MRTTKYPRNQICNLHKTLISNCCLPIMKESFGTTRDKLERFMSLVHDVHIDYKMNFPYRDIWRGLRYQVIKKGKFKGKDVKVGACMVTSWGYISLNIYPWIDPTPTQFTYSDTERHPKVFDRSEDFIELKQIYIGREYQSTGKGSEIMEYLKRKCNEYNFSLTVTSGSLKYSKGMHQSFLDDSNQSKHTSTSFNSRNRHRKHAILLGYNIKYWQLMTKFETEVVEEYKNNITESMLKPSPFRGYMNTNQPDYNDLQLEDGIRIRDWYMDRGFVPNFTYINDWGKMKYDLLKGKIKKFDCHNYNGDAFLIWWNPSHVRKLQKLYYPDFDTFTFGTNRKNYDSTINYMKYIMVNNRTDLVGRKFKLNSNGQLVF